jgi:hypothetical protein
MRIDRTSWRAFGATGSSTKTDLYDPDTTSPLAAIPAAPVERRRDRYWGSSGHASTMAGEAV